MATVFVSGGIHAEADEHELAALYRRHGAIPDWIMPAFAW
jgi:hypothetical protein